MILLLHIGNTYNCVSALEADTSSNYIKIFKTSGINSQNKMPEKILLAGCFSKIYKIFICMDI